jgi:trehalose synthase
VWNINATATGGGVAEMLRALVGYAAGVGIAARWTVIDGDERFFVITKRIHHWLHGADGDRGPLGEDEAAHYERVLDDNGRLLRQRVRRDDIVIVHDPQPAGLIPLLKSLGASVVWRCHVGATNANDRTDQAWSFLRPYVEMADAFVFSRAQYAPTWMAPTKVWTIPPSIDPFSPKNQELDDETVRAIMHRIGLVHHRASTAPGQFTRRDGTRGEVNHRADIVASAGPPSGSALIVQVSRWDPLKDMVGVMEAFARTAHRGDAYLALVGPAVSGVGDDPEGAKVLAECTAKWRHLAPNIRDRVALVSLPMSDVDENAAMVNAIQRHATVIVQKSLAEGFGLTVAEAMWKRRAVVASNVGGIPDQIVPGAGILLADPSDLDAAGHEIMQLVADSDRRAALGLAARERIRTNFLADRHLLRYADLLTSLLH